MNLPDLNAIVCIPPIKSVKKKIAQFTKQWPVVQSCIVVKPLAKKCEEYVSQIEPKLTSIDIKDMVVEHKLELESTSVGSKMVMAEQEREIYEL